MWLLEIKSLFFLGDFWGNSSIYQATRDYKTRTSGNLLISLVTQNKDISAASQTKLTKVRLHL